MKEIQTLQELYTKLMKDKYCVNIEYNKIKSILVIQNKDIRMLVDGRLGLTIYYKGKKVVEETFFEEEEYKNFNMMYNRIKFYLDGDILKKLYIKNSIIYYLNVIGLSLGLPLILLNKYIINLEGLLLLLAFVVLMCSFAKVRRKIRKKKDISNFERDIKIQDYEILIHDELVNLNENIGDKLSNVVKIYNEEIYKAFSEQIERDKIEKIRGQISDNQLENLIKQTLEEYIDTLSIVKKAYSIPKSEDESENKEILSKALSSRYTLYTRKKGRNGIVEKEYSIKEFKELLDEILVTTDLTLEEAYNIYKTVNISKEDSYRLYSKITEEVKVLDLIGNKLTEEKNQNIDKDSEVSLISQEETGKTYFYTFDKVELENCQHEYYKISGKEIHVFEYEKEYIVFEL